MGDTSREPKSEGGEEVSGRRKAIKEGLSLVQKAARNYPNKRDRAEARAKGVDPGGDIFIHGQGNPVTRLIRDWTWGCIAVTNDEIEEVYAMVRNGTPVLIYK